MLCEYLQTIIKPVTQLSVILVDGSYLPTESELQCQKNIDATRFAL